MNDSTEVLSGDGRGQALVSARWTRLAFWVAVSLVAASAVGAIAWLGPQEAADGDLPQPVPFWPVSISPESSVVEIEAEPRRCGATTNATLVAETATRVEVEVQSDLNGTAQDCQELIVVDLRDPLGDRVLVDVTSDRRFVPDETARLGFALLSE